MEKIIPAVSSSVRGPLGVAHLPRMWLTAIAHQSGLLADGYAPGGALDAQFAEDLQIDPAALAAFLATRPKFFRAEASVRANAGRLDAAAIAAHNARVGNTLQTDLADWERLHALLAARRGTPIDPMVPLVSMDTSGALGVKLLPRLWAKALIFEIGALPGGWRSGETRVVYSDGVPGTLATPGQGMDAGTVKNLGLDMDATIGYLHRERPVYPVFEAWVSANARTLDTSSISVQNAGPAPVSGDGPVAELARLGYPEMTTCGMFLDNDLGDWDAVHTQLVYAA